MRKSLVIAIAFITMFAFAEPGVCISPEITVNGLDGPLRLTRNDTFSIMISLDTQGIEKEAEWWIVTNTPFGWYHYNYELGMWISGLGPTYRGKLFDLPSYVLNISNLPIGKYTFYFGVDTTIDGVPNEPLYFDNVIIDIKEDYTANFLLGVGTTDPQGCVSQGVLKEFLASAHP
ncbi:MAG: hypothetical protein DRP09_14585 [Candidatus Thorarchaeota archaeon]|nr:MAG: hypothetical protein DRP09_14585 [Candidatus Thorarchaeota archaeon]